MGETDIHGTLDVGNLFFNNKVAVNLHGRSFSQKKELPHVGESINQAMYHLDIFDM